MKITHDYFIAEYHRFRDIMCSPTYTQQQKFDGFEGMLRVWLLCEKDTEEKAELRDTAIQALQCEFSMRMGLEFAMDIERILEKYSR